MPTLTALFLFIFPAAFASDVPNELILQNGCMLQSYKGTTSYPGAFCIFLDDGSFISASPGIRRIKKDKTVAWEVPGHFHHQIKLSPDGKRVLALSSALVDRSGSKERDDVIVVFDVETGALLHRLSGHELRTMAKLAPLEWPVQSDLNFSEAQLETSHLNSIYEIGKNRGRAPYLKSGNIIVNGLDHGVFILSPDLKKLLHHRKINTSNQHRIHDVQVSASGDLIYFNNSVLDLKSRSPYSAVEMMNPETGKLTFQFTARPKEMFFSPVCGGVQEVTDDLIFFSHQLNGGYVYSKKAGTVIRTYFPFLNASKLWPSQEMKLVDAAKFLENSK